ncbi:uncharacterized protein LOC128674478 [Plodia interpunctella]|uniref:uncharacterized protein LOC128674478 n=1 Tax=Plodia interpunctella TaxID=58824 RepID=UPI00310138E2
MLVIVSHTGTAYCRMVTSAVVVGFCHIIIGATLMPVVMYCMNQNFKDMHVPLYVFGFHFFCAEALLFLNYANGLSTPMRLKHRRAAHGILQVCGLLCILAATIIVYIERGASGSSHGLTGVVAATLAACSLLSYPLALYGDGSLKLVHILMGIPTFIVSSISLCLGFFTSEFKNWAGDSLVYILTGFVTFYTLVITIKIILKCCSRMKI